ncbi:MAG: hypothetical protein F4Y73_11810 [Gemmatimonadetes bacterium]|nr:hypothetical protein [Gemmatimonadota bacterium]
MRAMAWWGAVVAAAAATGAGVAPGAGVREAAAQDLRVAMDVDTTMIHLGDPVSVLLRVEHPADWSVEWADSLDVAPFEVLSYGVAPPSAAPGGDGAVSAAALVLTSFELGELEIPVIDIPVVGPDGTVRTLFTDPYRIGVVSVGLDESGDLREIRGPLSIARNWWLLIPWLLLAAAVAAGAFLLHRRRRARPVAEVARPKVPPRPHHLVALEALDELERSSLLERGEVKTWHVRVSEIVRTYVEGQLEVPALEMTTREVVAGLRNAALGSRITDTFHTFLARCDLVKFAKLRPGADASQEVLGVARTLVELTSGPGRGPESGNGERPDEAEEAAGGSR